MKTEPLPPGNYTVTVEKIRKVRNKPAYRMTLKTFDGLHVIKATLPVPQDDANAVV